MSEFSKFWVKKDQVEKPGESIHSAKWDECVQNVKSSNPHANSYAICTAQLGETSFKSEFKHLAKSEVDKAKKNLLKVGIIDAGSIPRSLLAEQDLEPEEDKEKYVKDAASGDALYDLQSEADVVAGYNMPESKKAEAKEEISDDIKQTQLKRQKATLKERMHKSFKDFWRNTKRQ